jgi:hypothetical protein
MNSNSAAGLVGVSCAPKFFNLALKTKGFFFRPQENARLCLVLVSGRDVLA